jgi:hypothetical protein
MSKQPTKLVRVTISALTRVEYTTVIEVPLDLTNGQLDDLASKVYRDSDGEEFQEDNEYWEEGSHTVNETTEDDDGKPEMKAKLVDGQWKLEET